jgi:hypothetical protein
MIRIGGHAGILVQQNRLSLFKRNAVLDKVGLGFAWIFLDLRPSEYCP